jgi:hypothetical protein
MIDRNVPRKFVADKDERLLEVGDMIEAQNITITQRGEGSGSIVKTMKGTSSKILISGSGTNLEASVTVIGKVEDPQRNKIYFFVASDSGHAEDMIVQYDPEYSTSGGYREVFRSTWLNFDPTGFVKANVVNKAFRQDGVLQTILYFTDNDNPPRKINVDRALNGDFDDYNDTQLDFALNVIKAAPITPPTFDFQTNTDVPVNNFERSTFQFAVQYVYTDGEVSAIGPYSKLAFPDHIAASGLEADESGQLYFTDNECLIDTQWRSGSTSAIFPEQYIKDVSKIRVLGTRDNGTTAFIIDEFDANSNLTREIFNVSSTVYEAASGIYKFYNDGVYQALSESQRNKLYDNVPFKAEGQAVVGNRLMYSNYEEGRPNTETRVNLTPRYSDEVNGGSVLIANDDTDLIGEDTTARTNSTDDMFWEWDFLDVAAFSSSSDTVPGGTLFTTSIQLTPQASVAKGSFVAGFNASNYLLTGSVTDQDVSGPYTYNVGLGHFSDTDTHIDIPKPGSAATNISAPTFTTSIASPEDELLSSFVDLFYAQVDEYFDDYVIEYDVTLAGTEFDAEIYFAPVGATLTTGTKVNCSGTFRVKWGFKVTHPDATTVKVYPYVKEISQPTSGSIVASQNLGGSAGLVQGNFGSDNATWGLGSGFTDQYLSSNITGGIDVIGNSSQVMRTFASKSTFKAGCTHDLGIVYYDKYNRSSFVNKLGSFYAKHPGERSGNRGVCSVEIDWNASYPAPSWADRYQIVYGGMSTYESFTQYSVGRAFVPRTSAGAVNPAKKQLYVKLAPLTNFASDKSAVSVNYSFTEGDKLRVVKYSTNGGTDPASDISWPLANDNATIIEFNVVGTATLDTSDNILASSPGVEHTGDFIIIEAPQVAAGIESQTPGTELKYPGWDWFSVAHDALGTITYPDGSAPLVDSLWGHTSVVEILTPRTSERKVWYEIGEAGRVGTYKGLYDTNHGPNITISGGDCYLRTTALSTPEFSGGSFQVDDDPREYVYKNVEIESQYVSDYFASKRWSRGRAHTTFEKAATVNRYNSITYSDIYADETERLSLSSFNLSQGNFFDLPSENGRCSYIEAFLDDLISLQETKCSLVKVNKNIIQTGTQSGLVSLDSNVLNNATPFGGDFGTQNPESVLIRDGVGYAVDRRRAAIFRLSLQGLNPISDTDIKSFVESRFSTWSSNSGAKIVSGYDQDDEIYYVTLIADSDEDSTTLGWDEKRSFWQGQYTFYPDIYASLGDKFFAAKYKEVTGLPDLFIHEFRGGNSNGFLGEAAVESKVTVVSNYNPSMVKQYNSISLEGDSAWTTTLESSAGQTTANLVFDEKEDAFYANVTGDTSSNSTNQYIPVGTVASVDGNVITMTNNLRGIHIPKGYVVYINNGGFSYVSAGITVSSVDRSNAKITVSNGAVITPNDKLFVANTGGITGDQIRGHYCKIKCSITPTSTQKKELYSINANFVNSKANHALGQQ